MLKAFQYLNFKENIWLTWKWIEPDPATVVLQEPNEFPSSVAYNLLKYDKSRELKLGPSFHSST